MKPFLLKLKVATGILCIEIAKGSLLLTKHLVLGTIKLSVWSVPRLEKLQKKLS